MAVALRSGPASWPRRARELLAAAAVISEASAQRLEPKRSTGAPSSSRPQVAGRSTVDWMRDLFESCSSRDEWSDAIRRADRELRTIRGQIKRDPKPDHILVLAWEGVSPAELSVTMGWSATSIRSWRRRAGVDPETGREKKRAVTVKLPCAERRAKVAELTAQGLSTREIAAQVGVSHVQVWHDQRFLAKTEMAA